MIDCIQQPPHGQHNRIVLPPQPVAVLQIALLPDLSAQVRYQGPASIVALEGMLGAAREQVLEMFRKQAQANIQVAPAALLES